MDTSEIYIKMCDCPEIQGVKKKFEDGDVLASYRQEWRKVDKDTQKAHKIFDGMAMYSESFTHIVERDLITWLPRQDQIQEMLLGKFSKEVFVLKDSHADSKLAYLIGVFKDFVHYKCEKMIPLERNRAKIEYFFTSMEQLWLAFYMHIKHEKTWDLKEEKWKK